MMSILLFTFESALHCQPGVIDSVSLLPVANVVESLVTKDPFAVDRKSRSNPAAVKPAGNGDLFVPAAVNRLSQSSVCVLPPTLVVVLALTSPSSWNAMSCTAIALPAVNSATAAASRSGKNRTWKRRLRLLPVSPRIRSAIVEPPHFEFVAASPGGRKANRCPLGRRKTTRSPPQTNAHTVQLHRTTRAKSSTRRHLPDSCVGPCVQDPLHRARAAASSRIARPRLRSSP